MNLDVVARLENDCLSVENRFPKIHRPTYSVSTKASCALCTMLVLGMYIHTADV